MEKIKCSNIDLDNDDNFLQDKICNDKDEFDFKYQNKREYYLEHPILTKLVLVDNIYFINKLNNMDLKEGEKVNENPSVYIKKIEKDGIIILSGCTKFNSQY